MSAFFQSKRVIQLSAWTFAVVLGVAAAGASAGKMDVKLSGDAEVPPVKSSGSASGTITGPFLPAAP